MNFVRFCTTGNMSDDLLTDPSGKGAVSAQYGINGFNRSELDFSGRLGVALMVLAQRSKRGEADLLGVLSSMNERVSYEEATLALGNLRTAGVVKSWLDLYDGGVLVVVNRCHL